MAITEAFLKRSRALWVKREKDYKAKAKHAHEMHKRRDEQLAARASSAVKVSPPMYHILQDTWGYHPPVHDGLDLICPPNEPLIAMCRSTVIRADAAGWWGKGAPSDPALKAKGDGVIVLRSLVDAGPIRKGMNFVYGHAEHATVRAGQIVNAGDMIGRAGFANAWHVHLCVNKRTDAIGVGTQDPKPIVDYTRKG